MKINNIGWQRVLIIILPYIIVVGIFQYIGALVANVDINDLLFESTSKQHLIMSFSSFISTFFVVWYFTKNEENGSFIIGFEIKNRLKDIFLGLSIGTMIISLGYLILIFLNEIAFENIRFDLKETVFTLLTFIFVALLEEVLMRGYILRNLMVSFNKYIALILSSILFTVMHGYNPNFDLFSLISLFVAGIFLGITYIHTKNLWFPIMLHLSWNFMQAMLGFKISGQNSYSLIEFSINENNRLNGGDFGFEGSILSLLFSLSFIIIIDIYYRRKTKYNKTLKV